MRAQLEVYFRAAFPAVAINSTDERRALAEVMAGAKAAGKKLVIWSATNGARDLEKGGVGASAEQQTIRDTEDLLAVCKAPRRKETVWVLLDAHTWPFDRDPILTRALKEFFADAPGNGSSVALIGNGFRPHSTLEELVVTIDHPLPDAEAMDRYASKIAAANSVQIKGELAEVTRALGGLTASQAENALSLSVIESRALDPKVIYREKVAAVRRTGLLEIVNPDPRGMEAIGGLENFKAWIARRRRAWSPEAKAFGIADPKGVLIVGVPGTGKSLAAKALGTTLGIPMLRLDVGSLFNSLVGASEERTRDALKLCEAIAPCGLWLDEIDKGLAGASGDASDSGVTRRVFGTIITWMQERRRPVFLVATANQVEGLPPELLRKGRFDEIFAIDLPTKVEREAIFKVHFQAVKRDPGKFDMPALVAKTEHFTGAEIGALVDDALFRAFDAGEDLGTDHIITGAAETVPLAITARERIDQIRAWARGRARMASAPEEGGVTTPVDAPAIRTLRPVMTIGGDDPAGGN